MFRPFRRSKRGKEEAAQALAEAEAALESIKARDEEVDKVSGGIKHRRIVNGFVEELLEIMGGKQ